MRRARRRGASSRTRRSRSRSRLRRRSSSSSRASARRPARARLRTLVVARRRLLRRRALHARRRGPARVRCAEAARRRDRARLLLRLTVGPARRPARRRVPGARYSCGARRRKRSWLPPGSARARYLPRGALVPRLAGAASARPGSAAWVAAFVGAGVASMIGALAAFAPTLRLHEKRCRIASRVHRRLRLPRRSQARASRSQPWRSSAAAISPRSCSSSPSPRTRCCSVRTRRSGVGSSICAPSTTRCGWPGARRARRRRRGAARRDEEAARGGRRAYRPAAARPVDIEPPCQPRPAGRREVGTGGSVARRGGGADRGGEVAVGHPDHPRRRRGRRPCEGSWASCGCVTRC